MRLCAAIAIDLICLLYLVDGGTAGALYVTKSLPSPLQTNLALALLGVLRWVQQAHPLDHTDQL